MRTISALFVALLFCAVALLDAKTIKVPQDYAKIQLAINAAVNGDTVLVAEQTYLENLFLNKKIVLGSLYLTDKDTSHISKTILDGSAASNPDSGSVITLGANTDTNLVITGFTIRGGKGNKEFEPADNSYWIGGGGIHSGVGGSARISHNIIKNNALTTVGTVVNVYGGGIGLSNHNSSIRPYVIIEHNVISSNSVDGTSTEAGGVGVYSMSGRIENNFFLNNKATASSSYCFGGGLSIGICNPLLLSGNMIKGNSAANSGGGIFTFGNATSGSLDVMMTNNIIAGNTAATGGGVQIALISTVSMINNTLVGNNATSGSGISVGSSATITLRIFNCNLSNLNSASQIVSLGGLISADHNLINGQTFGTNSINADPKFLANDTLYRLSASSPAIGAGALSATVGGVMMNAPVVDYLGMARPRPVSSSPDLGAIEHDSGNVTSVKELNLSVPKEFSLSQNYPNPFNPVTTIRYSLPATSNVKLTIYNVIGQAVSELVNEQQSAGWKEVQWNAAQFSSGMYFYKLQAGSFVETRKMLLVR